MGKTCYLHDLGVQLIGGKKKRHMKLLGVPSLVTMIEYRKKGDHRLPSASQVGTVAKGPINPVPNPAA